MGELKKRIPPTLNDEERNSKMVWGDKDDDDHKDWKTKQED